MELVGKEVGRILKLGEEKEHNQDILTKNSELETRKQLWQTLHPEGLARYLTTWVLMPSSPRLVFPGLGHRIPTAQENSEK